MESKFNIVYISSKITKTIIESQVINWIEILQNTNKVNYTIIFQVPITDLLRKKQRNSYNEIARNNKLKIKIIPIWRTKKNYWIEGWILKLYLIKLARTISKKSDYPLYIQTRVSKFHKQIAKIKNTQNIKFIYEHRGVGAEEYINQLGYKNITDISDKNIINTYYQKLQLYTKNFNVADAIINVSKKMQDYVKAKFPSINLDKQYVIAGAADQTKFFLSLNSRNQIRNLLKIRNDEILIIYTGSLSQPWHMKDFLFKSIEEIMVSNPKIKFLCITPHQSIALKTSKQYNLPSTRLLITTVPNKEINQYLNAADVGIIIRENLSTNSYASPTKIAEYLLAGLPTILSPNIGDYSEFIEKNKIGIICNNTIDEIHNSIDKALKIDRNRIANLSKEFYSKQSFVSKYLNIFKELGEY